MGTIVLVYLLREPLLLVKSYSLTTGRCLVVCYCVIVLSDWCGHVLDMVQLRL